MRRTPVDEPPARPALWSRRCALLGVAGAVAAIVASHRGWLRGPEAIGLLGAAVVLAFGAILLGTAAVVVIWKTGRPGVVACLSGFALSLLLLAGPGYVAFAGARLPAINDVSTDRVDPPGFTGTPAAVAARDGVAHDLPSAATRQAQASAYPDLQPLVLQIGPADAYDAALKLVRARRWRVLASHPPGHPHGAAGSIEAVARTAIMAFRDDVAIRVTPVSAERSRIDMRSASRLGFGDLGGNAARITSFMSDLDDAVEEP